jgi:hypothetical protein
MVIQGAAHKEEAPPEVSPSEVGVTPITFGFVVDISPIGFKDQLLPWATL